MPGPLFDALPPGVTGAGSLTGLPRRSQPAAARSLADRHLWTHLDVMDVPFAGRTGIPPTALGELTRAAGRSDVHLMVENPEALLTAVLAARPDRVTIHLERLDDPAGTAHRLRAAGVSPWLAAGPDSDDELAAGVAADFDGILVMLIRPGSSDPAAPGRTGSVRRLAHHHAVGVDGGVSADNLGRWLDAGARYVVAGRGLFGAGSGLPAGPEGATT